MLLWIRRWVARVDDRLNTLWHSLHLNVRPVPVVIGIVVVVVEDVFVMGGEFARDPGTGVPYGLRGSGILVYRVRW